MALDLDRVAKIAGQVCKAEAPKFQSDPEAALGQAWEKVVENEKKLLVPLINPDAWIWKTAWREARRAFKELQCKSTQFDERTHTLLAERNQRRDVPDLLTRQVEQQRRAEQIESLRAEFNRIPSDQQVAILVVTRCKDCGWISTERVGVRKVGRFFCGVGRWEENL